uniref:Uncharacterized protein n=1 Tax=Grammatophora oceanica TaxID=210454 RepID=A0A7S1UN07_9STRA|mmetsp:Transcript_11198/g.16353  ORF Transcript_11198/g.16353 Transcript_11198/m.16353 type:complete len:196 (+) Transcript_11198:227-814(+)|eukprot:CAMPEP_0194026878 /NCGR_PEP_ID=MMETSP0009_2-20130614/1129_1 /TAXON_ID=210454 /ORGANISM="Grammatophora oceanica, Strain CCMP 410" /LENGTH=195 /DNA_ID=CAMNT_0038665759 /DNA_START=207 /DNA_END=794 /DNA_ORIENTATION=-
MDSATTDAVTTFVPGTISSASIWISLSLAIHASHEAVVTPAYFDKLTGIQMQSKFQIWTQNTLLTLIGIQPFLMFLEHRGICRGTGIAMMTVGLLHPILDHIFFSFLLSAPKQQETYLQRPASSTALGVYFTTSLWQLWTVLGSKTQSFDHLTSKEWIGSILGGIAFTLFTGFAAFTQTVESKRLYYEQGKSKKK